MAIYESVQDVVNGAAVEIGLDPSVDVLASSDGSFKQLRYLLDAAGQELLFLNVWTEFVEEHQIVTTGADTGTYDLPNDFLYMIPQAGWERTNRFPLAGPLSPQQWQYLEGRNLVNSDVYVNFRIKNTKFVVLPNDPVPDGLDIRFEYVRNTWLQKVDEDTTLYTKSNANTDLVLFPPIMIKKFLKVKFLEAKGFESSKARDEFTMMFDSSAGKDGSAPILVAGGARSFPYLDTYRNTPDSSFTGG